MPISIKNDQAEQLARELAALTGESITHAIQIALEERMERLRLARSGISLADELIAIGRRCAKRPVISDLSDDEILGYDKLGVPSR